MKINLNKNIFPLILIFIIAFALRFYQLSFFEFKNDQYFAIGLGNEARTAHFLITHGMRSGLGLNNPPFFPYIMGVFTAFTNDPACLTSCFFGMNLLALAIAIIFFYCTLPEEYAVLSSAFLALFPAFTIYSNNIWAQCSLPLLMILFNISLFRLVKYELWWNFLYMGLLADVASQIHGSGFTLFPLLIIVAIAYWKKIDRKIIGLTLLASFVLFTPYLIHLFKEKEASNLLAFGTSKTRGFHWKIFTFHLRMASYDFFRTYFRFDFNQTLKAIAGQWRFILYPLTFIPGLLFIAGTYEYFRWLFKGKILDPSEGHLKEYPIIFQISGLMLLITTLSYILFKIPTSMHYCIVLFPAYSILTGFAALKWWKFYWGKIIVLLGILSTVILLIATLLFLDRAGGHSYEYGVSYKSLISWRNELQAMKNKNECFDLKVNFTGKGKADMETSLAVLNDNNKCTPSDKIIPANINISWDEKLMRYEHQIRR